MNKKFINFDGDDSISKYFKDVRKTKILTQDEEISLAKRIKDGDLKATDELVSRNLKFVITIAKEYQNQGLPLSDLISEGNLGLIKAANRFDHTKGFRFISYAVWWIKQSIIQSLNDNSRIIRLPSSTIQKLNYLNKEINKFEFQNEREPVFGEIFDKEENLMEIVSYSKCASLNDIINTNEGEGSEMIELISYENDEESFIVTDKLKIVLNKTLGVLDERERQIIESYYGINTECEGMTLEAIGERFGLTKERIRQIKNKSLQKLRFHSEGLYNVLINE